MEVGPDAAGAGQHSLGVRQFELPPRTAAATHVRPSGATSEQTVPHATVFVLDLQLVTDAHWHRLSKIALACVLRRSNAHKYEYPFFAMPPQASELSTRSAANGLWALTVLQASSEPVFTAMVNRVAALRFDEEDPLRIDRSHLYQLVQVQNSASASIVLLECPYMLDTC